MYNNDISNAFIVYPKGGGRKKKRVLLIDFIKRRNAMKKTLFVLLVILIAVPLVLWAGGRKKKAEKVEEAAEEISAEEMNEPDPWFTEKRTVMYKYIKDFDIKWRGLMDEHPVYDKDLLLTKGEVAQIKKGNYKIAYIGQNLTGEYSQALIGGCHDTADYLGMEWVAETDANFDAAKQKSDVETVLALKPDVIVGYPVDLTTGAEIFRPIIDAGIPLVIVSNRPFDYVHGKDFVANCTMNPYDGGYFAGKMCVEDIPPDAEVGIITFEADYFVLNVIDDGFKDALQELGPNLTVHEMGYVNWQDCGGIAAAMVQKYPNITAMYSTWFDPVMVMAADLRAVGREDIKLYTVNVNVPSLIDLVEPDGMIKGMTSDFPWNIGMNMAIAASKALLGKTAPEMVVVPSIPVTPDNVRELWGVIMRNVPMPDSLDDALKAVGK